MITELRISKDHRAFAGHFPGYPVLPGAVLLDEALHAIAFGRKLDLTRWQIASVKFLEFVRPGDELTLEHTAPNGTTIRFTIRSPSGTIASGQLSVIATDDGGADGG